MRPLHLSSDRAVVLQLGLLVAILATVARGAWVLAEVNLKVDVLWQAHQDHQAVKVAQGKP